MEPEIKDTFTRIGAEQLKAKIEKYWAYNRRFVECRIEREQCGREGKYIYYVRSDLGLHYPPRVSEPPLPRVKYVVHGV